MAKSLSKVKFILIESKTIEGNSQNVALEGVTMGKNTSCDFDQREIVEDTSNHMRFFQYF